MNRTVHRLLVSWRLASRCLRALESTQIGRSCVSLWTIPTLVALCRCNPPPIRRSHPVRGSTAASGGPDPQERTIPTLVAFERAIRWILQAAGGSRSPTGGVRLCGLAMELADVVASPFGSIPTLVITCARSRLFRTGPFALVTFP